MTTTMPSESFSPSSSEQQWKEKRHDDSHDHPLSWLPVATNEPLLADIEAQRSSDSILCTIPPPSPSARNRSTAYLDGLRGIAALLVMLQHYTPYFYGGNPDINRGFGQPIESLEPTQPPTYNWLFASFPFIRLIYSGGNMAVPIFFVLSGYVLSRSPMKKIASGRRENNVNADKVLLSAMLRRPVRLYFPPFFTTLAHACLMHAPVGALRKTHWPEPQPTLLLEINAWLLKFIAYFTPFVGTGTVWFEYSVVVWTLTWELAGSYLVYGLSLVIGWIYRVRPIPVRWTMLGLSVVGLVMFGAGSWAYACFTLGVILSMRDVWDMDLLWPTVDKRRDQIAYHAMLIVGLYLSGQPSWMGGSAWSAISPGWRTLTSLTPAVYAANEYHRFWIGTGGAMIVIAVRRLGWLQDLLASRPARYLGQVSFSLYLTHALVYYTVSERLHRALGQIGAQTDENEHWLDNKLWMPDWGPIGLSTRFVVAFSIVLSISLGVAHLGTLYLDQPSVKLGKWLAAKAGL